MLHIHGFSLTLGGSSGIGLATAIQCAKEGSAVTLIARNVKVSCSFIYICIYLILILILSCCACGSILKTWNDLFSHRNLRMPRRRLRLRFKEPLLLFSLVMFAVSFPFLFFFRPFSLFISFFLSHPFPIDGVKTKEVFAQAAKHHKRNIDVCIMSAGVSVPLHFEVRYNLGAEMNRGGVKKREILKSISSMNVKPDHPKTPHITHPNATIITTF